MTTINLPSWFDVLECEMSLVPEVRGFQGPFGGPTEVQDLIGDRWRLRVMLPDGDFNWGGRTEALFNRLRGGADWLRLYHFAKPVPRGNGRGSMVLASAVAQGANSLTITGVRNRNLLPGAAFAVDTNSDGTSDGWSLITAGTTGTATPGRPVVDGRLWQQVSATNLGTSTLDATGFQYTAAGVPVVAGLEYTFAVDTGTAGPEGSSVRLQVDWAAAGDVYISTSSVAINPPPGVITRPALTAVAPPTAVSGRPTIVMTARNGGSAGAASVLFGNAQFELGGGATAYAGLPTVLAGDMLGHSGEQLFQVYEDATATDWGVITVTTVNRARKAIASGQAIVWDKPTIPFQLLDNSGVPTAYTRGRARGQQVEFVEAWV